MRVAYVSSGLGYPGSLSKVAGYAVKELRKLGYDVIIGAVDKSSTDPEKKEYPLGRVIDFYDRYKPDVFFMNLSVWASFLSEPATQQEIIQLSKKVKFVLNAIVDAEYVGKKRRYPHYLFHSILMQNSTIADAIGVPNDRYVVAPLGVNPDIWKPGEGKKENDIKVAMVAANHPRKRWDLFVYSVVELARQVDRMVKALAWTNIKGRWNIMDMYDGYSAFRGITKEKANLYLPDRYSSTFGINEKMLAKILSDFDIHALFTIGESFGLPIAETLALGKPNVITDAKSLRELYGFCDKAIVFVKPRAMLPFPTEDTVYYDISPGDALNALKEAVDRREELTENALKCSKKIVKKFTWEGFAKGISKAIDLAYKHDELIWNKLMSASSL